MKAVMTNELKFQFLKQHPLFENMPLDKIGRICHLTKYKTIYRGERLGYGSGSYNKICLLIRGKIKITEVDENDNEIIKDLLTAPDIFGNFNLNKLLQREEYAEALTSDTFICYFSAIDFKKILEENLPLALNLAQLVNAKLTKLQGRHADLIHKDAKSRLIRFIKSWAMSDGSRMGDKIVLNNYLTQGDIAGVIATSRQKVNSMFNELRDAGLIYYDRDLIELYDPLRRK